MAASVAFSENVLHDISLAVRSGLIVPPLSVRSIEPGAIRIGDESYDPALLNELITRKIQDTPLNDLMFDNS